VRAVGFREDEQHGDKEDAGASDDCKSLEHLYDQLQEASVLRSSSTAGPSEPNTTSAPGLPPPALQECALIIPDLPILTSIDTLFLLCSSRAKYLHIPLDQL